MGSDEDAIALLTTVIQIRNRRLGGHEWRQIWILTVKKISSSEPLESVSYKKIIGQTERTLLQF